MKKEYENKLIKYLRSLILRCLIVIIIFLCMAIATKKSSIYKDLIVTNVYEDTLSLTKIKKLYTKYFGGIVPLEKIEPNITPVFNEELEYTNASIYHEGVKLDVTQNYLVPSQDEGMVIYIGEKENYGNVIIIENLDGIDTWYGNMETTSIKLYDYVESGSYLGQVKDNILYLVYSKDNTFLDYNEYLK